MNEKVTPEYVYNIKLKYKLGYWPFTAISPAGGDLCEIRQVSMDPTCWLYGFEDAQGVWPQQSDWNEPLLHIEESRDPDTKKLRHLIFSVQEWDGMPGLITWGTNNYPIWTESELEGPPGLMVGKRRAISVNLISDPIISGLEPPPPPPPEPSLFARIPWYAKATLFVGVPLVTAWQLTKRRK